MRMRKQTTGAESAGKQILCLNAVRLLAILLVFNSHCDALYPLAFLATGGAMGNALFFMISGYLTKMNDAFWPWIRRRAMRLYPATWIVTVIGCAAFSTWPDSVMQFVTGFLWPTGYWFIGALLLYNIILYLFEKLHVFEHFTAYSIVLWAVYLAYYLFFIDKSVWSVESGGAFRQIYYFYIFSIGYCWRTQRIRVTLPVRRALVLAAAAFCASPLLKLLMVKRVLPMSLQFLCQPLGVAFAVAMLAFALGWETRYRKLPGKCIRAIDFFSKHSLEIYLAQRTVLKVSAGGVVPVEPSARGCRYMLLCDRA